ncbi:protease PrtS [Naviculisporaceae sp. PSN 640]
MDSPTMDHTHRGYVCSIVPFYLLEAMAQSSDPKVRECGLKSLACQERVHKSRFDTFRAKLAAHHQTHHQHGHDHGIVPPNLLEAIAGSKSSSQSAKDSAQKTLNLSQQIKDFRAEGSSSTGTLPSLAGKTPPKPTKPSETGFYRYVYDMQGKGDDERPTTLRLLPGKLVRSEGDPDTSDKATDEVYTNTLKVLEFYKQFFDFNSLDGEGMPVISSVHFDTNMGNAFWWDGKNQMVYGDGDDYLYNFTGTIDVIGHEMTHAVTQFSSNLQYWRESGALNEHLSDVWGIMVKQWVEKETAEEADWLIGEGVLLPEVKGVALRSMKAPGTAYDDPRFGKDMQPDSVAGMEALQKTHGDWLDERDSGGVHIFSGIPNRAFVLVAQGFGGYSWEKAGQVWWKVARGGAISSECTFIQFADATVDAALSLYGEDAAKIVRDAWNTVGVTRKI